MWLNLIWPIMESVFELLLRGCRSERNFDILTAATSHCSFAYWCNLIKGLLQSLETFLGGIMKVCVMQSRLQVLCIRRRVHPSIHWNRTPLIKSFYIKKDYTKLWSFRLELKICWAFQQNDICASWGRGCVPLKSFVELLR